LPTVRAITVNMATLSGPATARWYDPSDGAFSEVPGSPFANLGSAVFTPPGNNSAGDGDWVLLLEHSTTRLVNLSTRATSGTGSNALNAGFVVSGGTESILVRGIGPGLIAFGVPGTLAAPQLSVYNGAAVIYFNDGWGGTPALQAAFAQTGAFALSLDGADAALIDSFAPGGYSAVVTGANNSSGIALIELYDADASPAPAGRLVNISVRAQVGTGDNVLIAGFVISGNAPETVLIRGIGPGLAQFGVIGALSRPQLDLYQGSTDLLENVGWGGSPALSAAFAETGAFALDPASADSAMMVTLSPGSYSAVISGVNNTTGVGLIEVYELP
jgi:Putative collagen-binding domain of a collagenase